MSGIYQISSIIKPERFYIGSAVDIKKRWLTHLRQLRRGEHHSRKLQRHYTKYNKEDLIFMILTDCDKVQLLQFEQYFLDFYNPYFNTCTKADNSLGYKPSITSRLKMSLAHIGKPTGRMGTSMSLDTKLKISNSHLGLHVKQETKDKISKSLITLGVHKKPILQLTLNNIFIKEWSSATDVANILKLDRGSIVECLKGRYKKSGGYIWKYKNNNN